MYSTIVSDNFPSEMTITLGSGADAQILHYEKVLWEVGGTNAGLRYGENPDQSAAMYRLVSGNLVLGDVKAVGPDGALTSAMELLLSGKHPGKINVTDADTALGILRFLHDRPSCAIVKHNNPCGVALGDSPYDAYTRALSGDRIAAFGGAIAINRELDRITAEAILEYYAEVIVAPGYAPGVVELLSKRKNLRVFRVDQMQRLSEWIGRRYVDFSSLIDGGLIMQLSFEPHDLQKTQLSVARAERDGAEHSIRRPPSAKELQDMRFGWFVESGVTSNSVIYVRDERTIAIGTGEQDRVGVARIARDKAIRALADSIAMDDVGKGVEELVQPERGHYISIATERHGDLGGSTMVSDAFFPFRDGVLVGLREGVSAVVQPGGAMRDWDVIEACNEFGATMVFTGQRSFRH